MIMLEAESLANGTRTAVLAPATTSDRALLSPDGEWLALDAVPLRRAVYTVTHADLDMSSRGGTITIKSIQSGRRYTFTVTDIYLVRSSDLTAEELAALGFATRKAFDEVWGQHLKDRRAWLIHLTPAGEVTVQ